MRVPPPVVISERRSYTLSFSRALATFDLTTVYGVRAPKKFCSRCWNFLELICGVTCGS